MGKEDRVPRGHVRDGDLRSDLFEAPTFWHGNLSRQGRAANQAEIETEYEVFLGAERCGHALRRFQLSAVPLTVGEGEPVWQKSLVPRDRKRGRRVDAA